VTDAPRRKNTARGIGVESSSLWKNQINDLPTSAEEKKRMHHAMQLYKSACTICFWLKGVVPPTVLFFHQH
jgi:hypothetical protein